MSELVSKDSGQHVISDEPELEFLTQRLAGEILDPVRFALVMDLLKHLQPVENLRKPYRSIANVNRDHQARVPNDERSLEGQIPGCIGIGCAGYCCDVKPKNSNKITLTRSEWEVAKAGPIRTDHLQVLENATTSEHRFLVGCLNGVEGCTGCGPSEGVSPGYVPEDCSVYPWFFDLDNINGIRAFLADRGRSAEEITEVKCPLPAADSLLHLPWAYELFSKGVQRDIFYALGSHDVAKEMHGYVPFDINVLTGFSLQELNEIMIACAEDSYRRTVNLALNQIQVETVEGLDDDTQRKLEWAKKAINKKLDQALSLTDSLLKGLGSCPSPIFLGECEEPVRLAI